MSQRLMEEFDRYSQVCHLASILFLFVPYLNVPGNCLRVLVGRLLMYESRVGMDVLESTVSRSIEVRTEIDMTIWGE
jgi:hypothetical protein